MKLTRLLPITMLVLLLAATAGLAQDDMCVMCHDDPGLEKIEGGVPVSLYANSEMIEGSVHAGFGCVDCHESLAGVEDFPHAKDLPEVNCSVCHPDATEEFMVGFRQHLVDRGFTNIPNCTQCHGNHEISDIADTRRVCGVCHNDVVKEFDRSIHNQVDQEGRPLVSCTSCHDAHNKTNRGDMLPREWRVEMVDQCLTCHESQSRDYLSSRHYAEIKRGNGDAPICVDCHNQHNIMAVDNPKSPVHLDNLDNTCDRCHSGHEASLHRKTGVDDRLMTCVACHTGHVTDMDADKVTYYDETLSETCLRCHGGEVHVGEARAHGEVMLIDDQGKRHACTECHVYHHKLDEETSALRLSCTNCHAEANSDWERSIHGASFRKGHAEAPTCVTCHGEREVERISSRFDGQSVISLCSSCHADREVTMRFQLNPSVVQGYLSTYHGKAYSLGYQGEDFATCVSCHDNHLILPQENPASTISQQHIIETCGRCHEDANENFVSMLQHYDPMQIEEDKHPVLDIIHVFMVWLLRITLTIFGLHTLLWLGRSIFNRFRYGKQEKHDPGYRIQRFNAFERITHAIVIVSFLTLALTGLPLKYSHTELSYWIANHLLSLHTMALMHRIAAGLTFLYFAMHLSGLMWKLALRRLSLKQMLWGPHSLVPQPIDAKQFFQHIGWFLGIAEKPQFGRFAYWEKFDYMAVFWGVAVIGASGLTLWFPEFFTQLLPGWAINAAHIIHSEEALLATGFIFTIHFFNEHLRPDNFPLDEVIFTGSIGAHHFEDSRALWKEQLRKEGKLEQVKVQPMHPLPRTLLYIFGFTSAAIGLALLALIVIGTFTGAH